MDSSSQAIASLNDKLASSTSLLNNVASAAIAVEQMAAQANQLTGGIMSGADKLKAGIAIVSALDPAIAAPVASIEAIFGAVVGALNLFGIFKHGSK